MASRGVPALVIGSDQFEPLAHGIATSLGAPWMPVVTVPHPIGGLTGEEIEARVLELWPLVAQRLAEEGGSK